MVVLTGEEGKGAKEWECKKCKWTGKNIDEKELTELFWLIKDNYDDDNLQRFDGAMYGYYFIYTIDNHLKIEVGLNSVRKYENNNCTLLKVSKSLINEIVDFFETKNLTTNYDVFIKNHLTEIDNLWLRINEWLIDNNNFSCAIDNNNF